MKRNSESLDKTNSCLKYDSRPVSRSRAKPGNKSENMPAFFPELYLQLYFHVNQKQDQTIES